MYDFCPVSSRTPHTALYPILQLLSFDHGACIFHRAQELANYEVTPAWLLLAPLIATRKRGPHGKAVDLRKIAMFLHSGAWGGILFHPSQGQQERRGVFRSQERMSGLGTRRLEPMSAGMGLRPPARPPVGVAEFSHIGNHVQFLFTGAWDIQPHSKPSSIICKVAS